VGGHGIAAELVLEQGESILLGYAPLLMQAPDV